MENPSSVDKKNQDLKKRYKLILESYFLSAVIFDRLPKEDQEIFDYFQRRNQIENELFPYFILYAAGVVGFHIGVVNRYFGKGLIFSKIFYYSFNALCVNEMIRYFVYEKQMKPYTQVLARKYEGFLLDLYPNLRNYRSNYRIEEKDLEDNQVDS